jgi:hypothetical protein
MGTRLLPDANTMLFIKRINYEQRIYQKSGPVMLESLVQKGKGVSDWKATFSFFTLTAQELPLFVPESLTYSTHEASDYSRSLRL